MTISNETLSALIGSIYDAALDATHGQAFLTESAALHHSDKAFLYRLDNSPGQPMTMRSLNPDTSILNQWEGSVDHVDLWFQIVVERPVLQPEVYSHLIPIERPKITGLYADYLIPLDIHNARGYSDY